MIENDDVFHARENIAEEVERTAEWRDDVGRRFPEDARNADAATALRALAAEIRALPLDDEALSAFAKRYSALHDDDLHDVGVQMNEFLRAIGFAHEPKNAREFLTRLVAECFPQVAATLAAE